MRTSVVCSKKVQEMTSKKKLFANNRRVYSVSREYTPILVSEFACHYFMGDCRRRHIRTFASLFRLSFCHGALRHLYFSFQRNSHNRCLAWIQLYNISALFTIAQNDGFHRLLWRRVLVTPLEWLYLTANDTHFLLSFAQHQAEDFDRRGAHAEGVVCG